MSLAHLREQVYSLSFGDLKKVKTKYRSRLEYGQFINEKLCSLMNNLVQLKVSTLTKDKRKSKYLMNKFFYDSDISFRKLIVEVREYGAEIKMLSSENDSLNNLLLISKKQKKYLNLIGKNFVEISKELIKN